MKIDRLATHGSLGFYPIKPKKKFAALRWFGTCLLFACSWAAFMALIVAIYGFSNQ